MNIAKHSEHVILHVYLPQVTLHYYASLSEATGFGGTWQFRSSQADGQRKAWECAGFHINKLIIFLHLFL